MTNDEFILAIDDKMADIRATCYKKVVEDKGRDIFAPDFELNKFVVTKREIERSLDTLPVSIRSSMITACFSFFNAIHEP